ELVDARGAVLATTHDDVAVYRAMRRRLTLPVPEGTTGPLSVRLLLNTEREDLPPGGALPAEAVTRRLDVGG
ncbi:MAG TPA: hypothetical protein VFR81_15175, partial [Longimicrobium sp.]|nr:hypothetical protein [Longimicrobium sp.]